MRKTRSLGLVVSLMYPLTVLAQTPPANVVRDVFNVRDYGAVGNGSTDDTTAVQNAANAIPSGGGVLFFPEGDYILSAGISLSNRSVAVEGLGIGVSILDWQSTSSGGIHWSANEIHQRFSVTKLTLGTSSTAGGTAISASWPSVSSSTHASGFIQDVQLYSRDESGYWTTGIQLDNAWNVMMSDIWIKGAVNTRPSGTAGVLLADTCIDIFMSHFSIYFFDKGLSVTGPSQGIRMSDSTIVYVNNAVDLEQGSGIGPHFVLSNNHFSVFDNGVVCNYHTQGVVTGNLIYKRDESSENFVGINLGVACDSTMVVGNQVHYAGAGGANNGIIIGNSTGMIIMGNLSDGQTTGVWLQSTSSNSTAIGNRRFGGTTTVQNDGTGNVVANNAP